ncbi:hypothetical protein [Nocardia terpenica]|uniref:Uncharacterized protein n=1 Tax=Nocardia terpenica TaxID=455432 RepID=A0A6G9YZ92_9NOCA|nr:hypothetical protein [Nocardia terpenica]QIS18522.1 hypothetical protein F6W96_09710 [Nocardia terpenica]
MKRLVKPPAVKLDFISAIEAWVRSLLGINSAHGAAIAELETRLATGSAYVDKFNRPNAPVLGNDWIQGGAGQRLGIIDSAARIDNTGISTGIRYAICPQQMTDDNHSVAAIVNPAGVMAGAMTSLYLRANADLTEFVYLNAYRDALYIGRGTRSDNNWTFNDWKSVTSRGVRESDTIEFVPSGTTYKVVINRTTILEHTDVSGYPIDSEHRTVGFSSETKFQGIIPNYSWGLAAFSARSGLGQLSATHATATAAQETAAAAQVTAHGAQATATHAQTTVAAKPNYSDIPTDISLWENLNPKDDTTFPLSQAVLLTNATKDGGESESIVPFYTPASGALELGFIRARRDRTYNEIGLIIGPSGWSLVNNVHICLYKLNQSTGDLDTLLWTSGDIKSQLSQSDTHYRFNMSTTGTAAGPITAAKGDVFAVGFLQNYFGLGGYELIALQRYQIAQPAGIHPRQPYYWSRGGSGGNGPGFDSPPSSIPFASFGTNKWWPWFVLG